MVTDYVSRLQQAREAKGMSREKLAVEAGISYNYVTALERNDRSRPNVVIAQRIAMALGLTVADLWPPDMPSKGETEGRSAS